MTCTRSQEFLAKHDVVVREQVAANKAKLGRKEALALARSVGRVIAMRGKKIVELDLADDPSDAELAAVLLGPTGNLRAPAIPWHTQQTDPNRAYDFTQGDRNHRLLFDTLKPTTTITKTP